MKEIDIIATIGPASKEQSCMEEMLAAGMTVARLNFSWGTHEEHQEFVARLRAASEASGKPVAILQDLSGPRVQQEVGHTFNSDVRVLTDKDKADVEALANSNVEYIALSFVKDAADIAELRAHMESCGATAKVIAKIERQEALDNLDEIIAAADGIMIARGDLGDAVPYEQLPFIKKRILKHCRAADVPAIVATEMLTSMLDKEKPTRADVSDMAHAVLDGAGCTMLSNETAVGEYPVVAVGVMRKVVDEAALHTTIGRPLLQD